MIPVTHLRQGVTFMHKNHPHRVMEYSHTHMGRGGGTIKVKVKNLKTGSLTTESFKSGDKVEDLDVSKKEMQYLFTDGNEITFMDPRSYEQMTVAQSVVGDQAAWLKEGENAWVMIWQKASGDEILDVELPPKVVFTVTEAAPGDKGNTAQNSYKEAVLENGVKVKVPLFVNQGDAIRISTVDGSYVERA